MPSDLELAWLAGWLEGEGSFFAGAMNPKRTPSGAARATISAWSVDNDVVLKAQRCAGGIGAVNGPYIRRNAQGSSNQPIFHWRIQRTKEAIELMRRLRPLMGARRQQQIDAAIERVEV